MRTAAPKYHWNLSRRLPGPKAVELLRRLVEEDGHLTSILARAGYMSASEPDPFVDPAWRSSPQPCECSSGGMPLICAANASGGKSPNDECGLTSL